MFEGPKMTNRFEIEGLAARQAQRHFANDCHVTSDTRPSLVFFLQVKKAERVILPTQNGISVFPALNNISSSPVLSWFRMEKKN